MLTIPDDAQPAGCWSVLVSLGESLPAVVEVPDCNCFVVMPTPTLESAVIQDDLIIVEGDDLSDTRECGGKRLRFQLVKAGATADDKPINAEIKRPLTPTRAVLALPAEAKTGTWNVQVLLDNEPVVEDGKVELKQP